MEALRCPPDEAMPKNPVGAESARRVALWPSLLLEGARYAALTRRSRPKPH